MSHFHYVLLFLLASSLMATLLQTPTREDFLKLFLKRYSTPLLAYAGVSWGMYLLGKL
jgi:hypothetical protein